MSMGPGELGVGKALLDGDVGAPNPPPG